MDILMDNIRHAVECDAKLIGQEIGLKVEKFE